MDEVIKRARELALAEKQWGIVPERALRNGAYDEGDIIKRHIPQAEIDLIKDRTENEED